MQPVASPETMTCARADPLTPALRASRPVHVSSFSCHSSRGPESTAEILLWPAHACQGDDEVVVYVLQANAARRCLPTLSFSQVPGPRPRWPLTLGLTSNRCNVRFVKLDCAGTLGMRSAGGQGHGQDRGDRSTD